MSYAESDTFSWPMESKGIYTVKSMYIFLRVGSSCAIKAYCLVGLSKFKFFYGYKTRLLSLLKEICVREVGLVLLHVIFVTTQKI